MGDALAWIADPLSEPIVVRALAELAILGVVAGALGTWIVLYGVAYSAESLAHGLFPGLVLAALAGAPLVAGGAAGAGVAAVAIAAVAAQRGIDRDTSIGVVITGLFGLGVLLALRPASPPGLAELLFGDVLAVSTREVVVTALVGSAILLALGALHGRLLAVGFDRDAARALGLSPRRVEALLLVLVAAAVVIGLAALGSLLVVAVLVAPAVAARALTRRVPAMMLVAAAVAVACGAAGIYASWYLATAAGASIALVLVAVAATATALGAARR